MLYAVTEIVGFLLLATLLGGAAGWWLARTGKVSVAKAMDRSGAHAAAERELESARAEIAQLTAKLAVAKEAIRELETEGGTRRAAAVIPEAPAAPVELHAVEDEERSATLGDFTDGGDDVPDAIGTEHGRLEVDEAGGDEGGGDLRDAAELAQADVRPGNTVPLRSKDRGGKRLSTRVAEASVVPHGEGAIPKIEFGDPAPEDD